MKITTLYYVLLEKITGKTINEKTIEKLKKKGVKIGMGCDIYPTASFGSEPYLITLGNHVRVNHHVTFITHDGGVWVLRKYISEDNSEFMDLFGSIVIGNNVHIGTNATIMPGVHVGDNCIIGCDAVVTKDIPNNSIAVGVPAKVIESIDDYYNKHYKEFDYLVRESHMSENEKRKYLLDKYTD